MYIILWEYLVKEEHIVEFEELYSANGVWARLFHKSSGFLRTDLLRDEKHPRRYITVDQWAAPEAYELFLSQWKNEYAMLDAQCEHLTEQETLLAKGGTVQHGTG